MPVSVNCGRRSAVATPTSALAAIRFCSASATSGRCPSTAAGSPGGTAGGDPCCSGLTGTLNEGAGCPQRIASACASSARAGDVLLLRHGRLELRLRLVQDNQAHQPGADLDAQQPDLLLIGDDSPGEGVRLRVEQAQRVVALRHVGLHGQPDHRLLVRRRGRLRIGRLQRSPDASPDVDLVAQIERHEPVVVRGGGPDGRAGQRTGAIRGRVLATDDRIERDGWQEKAGRQRQRAGLSTRATACRASDWTRGCRDQGVESRFAIEPPPVRRDRPALRQARESEGRRRLEGGTRVLRSDHAAARGQGEGRDRDQHPEHAKAFATHRRVCEARLA